MIIKDHKDNLNRELSLVEQKKMQWAKEREEMAKLEQYHSKLSSKYEKNTIRTQLITNTEIVQQNNNVHQRHFGMRRVRSPSLPPIEKTITRQGSNNSDQSSGYLSGSGGSNSLPSNANVIDPPNHYDYKYSQARLENVNDKLQLGQQQKNDHRSLKNLSLTSSINDYTSLSGNEQDYNNGQKSLMHSPSSETSSIASHDVFSMSSYANSSALDSSMSYQKSREGGRAKWGSYLFDTFSKDNGRSSRNTNGPVWLEKSLNEARDSEEETMSISVQSVSSFLRGQNVPVDPVLMAERESKRRKAMELQQAIKEQLQEREYLKKVEREKQLQIEKLEEERLKRQIEEERQRLEKEQNLQYEKLENERKKEEAMRKALEKASQEAQLERQRKRRDRIAMQNAIDETISIQKVGEKTEIFIDEPSQSSMTPTLHENIDQTTVSQTPVAESYTDNDGDDDDGETVLIGTPIKLKKKNLDTFRKFHKRQQRAEENKNTSDLASDDDTSSAKTSKSVETNNEKNMKGIPIQSHKVLSELDGIALVLQSMPLVPFVPLSNEFFNYNQFNNLALLMAAQNRMSNPNVMLPIISKENTAATINEKIELSQFILPQSNQQTITLQIQQVDSKQVTERGQINIQSVPPTPDQSVHNKEEPALSGDMKEHKNESSVMQKKFPGSPLSSSQSIVQTDTDSLNKDIHSIPTPLPNHGTFTKDECQKHDAFTSTFAEKRFVEELQEKTLTPQKYRSEMKFSKTVGTQTESFLFCEYCSYQHQHHHHCLDHSSEDVTANNVQTETTKSKDKKNSEIGRPQWGVRNPPVKYLKASERDPFYGKNRKKRYLKKNVSESEKTDDSCTHSLCPLVKNLTPKRFEKFGRDNSYGLPIKYDRFGRICLLDDQSFIRSETLRRINKSDVYTSDAESSVDIKHKSFFLPKTNDFQDIFLE